MADTGKKIALVTGGSRGIGRAIALRLASEGCHVVVNHTKNEPAALEVADAIRKSGGSASVSGFDVSDFDTVQSKVEGIIAEYGGIHIPINNAGITHDTLLMRMDKDDWDSVITTNLTGVFNCTKAVTRTMIKQRSGRIINITSVVGEMGNSGQTNYAASKAGIIGFTKAAARDRTRCRLSTQYQAAAEPASPSVSNSTIDSAGPNRWVIGATSRLSARIEVFAIMLMPSGAFMWVVKNGSSRWNSTRSPCARKNRKTP